MVNAVESWIRNPIDVISTGCQNGIDILHGGRGRTADKLLNYLRTPQRDTFDRNRRQLSRKGELEWESIANPYCTKEESWPQTRTSLRTG